MCAHLRRFLPFSDIYICNMYMYDCINFFFWMVPVLVIDVRNCCKRYANVQTKQSLYIHTLSGMKKKQTIKIYIWLEFVPLNQINNLFLMPWVSSMEVQYGISNIIVNRYRTFLTDNIFKINFVRWWYICEQWPKNVDIATVMFYFIYCSFQFMYVYSIESEIHWYNQLKIAVFQSQCYENRHYKTNINNKQFLKSRKNNGSSSELI